MFSPTMLFPDTVAAVVTHLNAQLTPPVHGRVPDPRPTTFVTVTRTGGFARGVVEDVQLTVEAWAATPPDAEALAQLARYQLHSLAGTVTEDVTFYRCDELAGPQDVPDPLTDTPRSIFTVVLTVKGSTPA